MDKWEKPEAITYGTALDGKQLNATTPLGGTMEYSPAPGTILNAGAGQVLRVSFTPADTVNYTVATATVHIDVNKATPAIKWRVPAAIPYGTALSGTQLNASASVAGKMVYSPPAGTILNAGAGQELRVSFTPTDTANYTGATATVHIDVTKAKSGWFK